MSGYYAIWMTANEVFDILLGDESPIITARTAVYILSVTQLIGAILSLPLVFLFGRKSLLLAGTLLSIISLVATGIAI